MDQAKHGYKCSNNVCERNEHSVHTRALTLLMARHGKVFFCTHVDQHNDINSTHGSRSQTLSPVRNYNSNTLTTGKEPKLFVQIKRSTEQQMKPYKVSEVINHHFNYLRNFPLTKKI